MNSITLVLDIEIEVIEWEGFKHNLILQNIWRLYMECTWYKKNPICKEKKKKSNLQTIYKLRLSSQGTACTMQWFYLNYSMKNLG